MLISAACRWISRKSDRKERRFLHFLSSILILLLSYFLAFATSPPPPPLLLFRLSLLILQKLLSFSVLFYCLSVCSTVTLPFSLLRLLLLLLFCLSSFSFFSSSSFFPFSFSFSFFSSFSFFHIFLLFVISAFFSFSSPSISYLSSFSSSLSSLPHHKSLLDSIGPTKSGSVGSLYTRNTQRHLLRGRRPSMAACPACRATTKELK